MKTSRIKVHGLDVFRSPQAQEVAARWQRITEDHQRAVDRMWLGTLITTFDAFDMSILRDMGFLSLRDEQLLVKVNGADL